MIIPQPPLSLIVGCSIIAISILVYVGIVVVAAFISKE